MLVGLPLNGLIIQYLWKKPPHSQTPFDFILTDTMFSGQILCLFHILDMILGLFPIETVSCSTTSFALAIPSYLAFNFFMNSCQVTILAQFIHIKLGIDALEYPDRTVRLSSLVMKLLLTVFMVCMDQFGPIQTDILASKILCPGLKR
jgi:hypothetical protein